MSNRLAIYYFLRHNYLMDSDKWFRIREVASAVSLSVDRTRKHLSVLALKGEVETRVEGWCNVYRARVGR